MATGNGHWMQSAVKPSHRGVFKAKAEKAGMSTQAYAKKVRNDPKASAKTKKQANLAITFGKYRNKTRHKNRSASRG